MTLRRLTALLLILTVLALASVAFASDGNQTAAALGRQLAGVVGRMEVNWPVLCAFDVVNGGTHLYGTLSCYSPNGLLLP